MSESRERQIDPALVAAYAPEIRGSAPRLLGGLDREPDSVSAGSFDRVNWGWKFRDFPLGGLQLASYPLALLWRHRVIDGSYHRNPRLFEWLLASVEETLSRQHRNGAFSAFVPNEQDTMSTLGIAFGLAETLLALGEEVPVALRDRTHAAIYAACSFSRGGDEGHAFVSNHWAMAAVAWRDAFELTGEDVFRAEAEAVIDRILSEQSPEGWYNEYGGPDPGYETFGIFYLALYWQRTGCERTLASLAKSVEFQAYGVHPDGRIGGAYGSRHASLYMPAGFEILASELPMAAAVAAFMRDRYARRNVVTPASADVQNLTPLMYGYVEACFAKPAVDADLPSLPCEREDLERYFDHAGLQVVSNARYYAVLNASKGGVCRVFDKQRGRVAYRDSGYVVRAGRRRWTSQLIGLGRGERSGDELVCRAELAEVRQPMPTPFRFVILRLLNLTLFRHPGIGGWIRKQIVVRLVKSKKRGPLTLTRSVRFAAEEIRFEDRLATRGSVGVDEVSLPRSFTAIHMGSAKYFHPSELDDTPQAPVDGMAETLRRDGKAERTFSLRFREGVDVELGP